MSKSIYEEALETIKAFHEDWFELGFYHDTFETTIQALEQAQKQEKKHRELFSLYSLLIDNCNDFDLHDDMISEIKNKIEVLENEQ